MQKPRAILFDLDDTILPGFSRPDTAWAEVVEEVMHVRGRKLRGADRPGDPMRPRDISGPIPYATGEWRVRIGEARRKVVAEAFGALAREGYAPPPDLPLRLADRFTAYCDEEISIFHDAHDVLGELRGAVSSWR